MGKKIFMLPVEEVNLTTVKYEREVLKAPHLTDFGLRLFIRLAAPIIGSLIMSYLKKHNGFTELENIVIPETPMFRPEFPPQGIAAPYPSTWQCPSSSHWH
ncbi:hypothetical protein IFM89_018856 [Coptis chinensis]|uniref:Uncharacterized protein n=1 Tax=Coptis chinensis TaxID=261450 RepID=A0A835HU82_9MAGN|nr:hypothetical protein IFM89_018856 [Coptis chinensis]